MMFNSMQFALFFPAAVLLYYIFPHKMRKFWLLAASYFYYMCWNPGYALLLLTSTAITYASGLLMGRAPVLKGGAGSATGSATGSAAGSAVSAAGSATGSAGAGSAVVSTAGAGSAVHSDAHRRRVVALSFILNLGILGFFKYFGFATDTVASIASALGIQVTMPAFDILLPVGISFYIFQALSYTMDVYRGEILPERDFFKYALFVSFFPQLVAGPIERSKNLLSQFDEVHTFEYDRVRTGLIRMLWGFFLKLVIAQRLSIVADLIYGNSGDCTGYQLCLGTFAFAFQIYCDFASYSEIAIGSALVMGFRLMENFRQPFFAASCKELWNRWHISLNTWFRDYLYFPLGGSRVAPWRKHLNLMIVFLVSGLWHGAAWTYVIWGGLSGLFQVLGTLLKAPRTKLGSLVGLKPGSFLHKGLSILSTFLLFNLSLVFFRSENVGQALDILRRIFTAFGFSSILTTSPFALGLGAYHMLFLIGALVILLIGDVWKEKGHTFAEIGRMQPLIKYSVLTLLILMILGSANFSAAEFIYFQF